MTQEAKLDWALGHRHGLLPTPARIAATPADIDGIHNWSVAYSGDDPWRAAGGGVAWSEPAARNAAIAEALERYAAVSYELPIIAPADTSTTMPLDDFTLFSASQRSQPTFPHGSTFDTAVPLTDVYRLTDNSQVLAPAALVGLTARYGALPTSSGLAAGPTTDHALLRSVQELIERDAFMATWLHALAPPAVSLPSSYTDPVSDRAGWVVAFDITPRYSPHAVAMVVGNLPLEGRPRLSLGIACRGTWSAAADKAYLEWTQGVIFAGHRCRLEPDVVFATAQYVRDFDHHAVYYTVHPDRWQDLPFMSSGAPTLDPPQDPKNPVSLADLVTALDQAGIRLFYRDLTLPDLGQIGLRVVRVLSPDLTPIHADHQWPHLGGTTPDVSRRFVWSSEPWARPTASSFPSPHPHPLG